MDDQRLKAEFIRELTNNLPCADSHPHQIYPEEHAVSQKHPCSDNRSHKPVYRLCSNSHDHHLDG